MPKAEFSIKVESLRKSKDKRWLFLNSKDRSDVSLALDLYSMKKIERNLTRNDVVVFRSTKKRDSNNVMFVRDVDDVYIVVRTWQDVKRHIYVQDPSLNDAAMWKRHGNELKSVLSWAPVKKIMAWVWEENKHSHQKWTTIADNSPLSTELVMSVSSRPLRRKNPSRAP